MTIIWRKVKHNGDECYAYCGRKDGERYAEKCSAYDPEHLCRECRYRDGRVIDEEEEEE